MTITGVTRVEASVVWEDCERAPFSLFLESSEAAADALWPDSNAALITCMLPAWRSRERRVRIAGALCPVLALNARVALATLAQWYPALGPPPTLEGELGTESSFPRRATALSLLSGGVDSLATLQWNRLHVPTAHPLAITATVPIVFGRLPSASRSEFENHLRSATAIAQPIADDAQVKLLPVRTNIWGLVDNGYFYDEVWHGAVLAGVAAFLSGAYHRAYIGSSYTVAHLHPWGSHPLLDNYYSSSYFQVEHHGLELTRLEKTALIAEWPVALDRVRVCQKGGAWQNNCGTCEKCIRTMTALAALGRLEQCAAFPQREVTRELIESIRTYRMISTVHQTDWYAELLPALVARGRNDLAGAIREYVLPLADVHSSADSRHPSQHHYPTPRQWQESDAPAVT